MGHVRYPKSPLLCFCVTRFNPLLSLTRRKCTYTFSPISGLILSHAVDEIDPAPHMTAYEALRLALGMRWIGAGSGAAAQTAVSTPATGGGGAGAVVRAKVD